MRVIRDTASRLNDYLARASAAQREQTEVLVAALQNGEIIIPQIIPQSANRGGGTNHCPNSDLAYSELAATVPGTTPATAGDTNHECHRFFRQQKGSNVTADAAHALKSVGHSLFAADEGVNTGTPRWDRTNGWAQLGAAGATQYDVAVKLPASIVTPGQPWYFLARLSALTLDLLPAGVQLYAGVWVKAGAYEGWAQGGNFTLSHRIEGQVGSQSAEYRVLAKTDSGVSMLSAVLAVANVPDVLSLTDYVQLYFNTGPGFIEFEIYKKVGASYFFLFSIRNSEDLQYNDVGAAGPAPRPVQGWPTLAQAAPQAYASSRDLRVATLGQPWALNQLTVVVPSTYDYSLTTEQYLRFGLTAPTAVDRQVGVDRLWFSSTFNEWGPEDPRIYPSGPSVAPTSGFQGGGNGVYDPPDGGTGGQTCVVETLPVLVREGRRLRFRRFRDVRLDSGVKGEHAAPYQILGKKLGTASAFYRIRTANGVTYDCNGTHRLVTRLTPRAYVEARQVEPGLELAGWTRGRKVTTKVVSVELIPLPVVVGTFSLRHPAGLVRDGEGLYVAGRSRGSDRGLFSSNTKMREFAT